MFLVLIIGTFALLYFLTKHNVGLGQTLHHSKKLKVQVQCCKVLDRNLVLGMFTCLNKEYSPQLSLCFVPCMFQTVKYLSSLRSSLCNAEGYQN